MTVPDSRTCPECIANVPGSRPCRFSNMVADIDLDGTR